MAAAPSPIGAAAATTAPDPLSFSSLSLSVTSLSSLHNPLPPRPPSPTDHSVTLWSCNHHHTTPISLFHLPLSLSLQPLCSRSFPTPKPQAPTTTTPSGPNRSCHTKKPSLSPSTYSSPSNLFCFASLSSLSSPRQPLDPHRHRSLRRSRDGLTHPSHAGTHTLPLSSHFPSFRSPSPSSVALTLRLPPEPR